MREQTTPNVLLVTADQLRRDGLGCYGDPVTLTPHFDQLAASGTRFTNCVSSHPVCSPWRATLQTGQYAHVHGVTRNNLPINTDLPSLADAFNAAGYLTAFYGKAHWWDSGKPGYYPEAPRMRYHEWWGFNRGHYHWDAPDFDEHGNETHRYAGLYEPTVQTDRAIDFLSRTHDRPWFLQLNWGPPHNATMDAEYRDPKVRELLRRIDRRRGFNTSDAALDDPRLDDPGIVTQLPQHFAGRLVPEGYLGLYCESDFGDRPDVREVDRDVVRAMQREYSAMTTSIDDEMGRLLNALEERGLRENTIVIFTADHGDHLGAHGNRRGKATPLQSAWRTPLIVSGPGVSFGETSDVLVSGVDLLPTICGLAGVRSHDGLPGHDVSAVAQDSVLSGLGRWRALVTKKWCLAVEFPEDGRPVCRSLVDLENDPYDLHDLQHELPEVRHKLHDQLMERLRGTDDPLAPQN